MRKETKVAIVAIITGIVMFILGYIIYKYTGINIVRGNFYDKI